jgi:hypothetical protein
VPLYRHASCDILLLPHTKRGIILEEATSDAGKRQQQTHRSSTRALPFVCGETRAKLLISAESVVLRALGASLHSRLEHAHEAGQTQAITLSTRSRYSPSSGAYTLLPVSPSLRILRAEHQQRFTYTSIPTRQPKLPPPADHTASRGKPHP